MIQLSDVYDCINRYVQIGFMEAVRIYEPAKDMIRKSELESWLKLACISKSAFSEIEKAGLIKARKKGSASNSPLYYSKKEIKQALTNKKLLTLLEEYKNNL